MASPAGHGQRADELSLELFTADDQPLARLRYTNEAGDGFRWIPDRFVVRLCPRPGVVAADRLELCLPPGWRALPRPEPTAWLVFPAGLPEFPVRLQLVTRGKDRKRVLLTRDLPVDFCGRNRFDPQRDRLPWANRIDDLGEVEPDPLSFRKTFRLALGSQRFFQGLYREVVRLRRLPDGRIQGGLCTGLSRTALARALGWLGGEVSLREVVLVLHGRQLSDRALLAGLPWFLLPSPRRAYHAFVRDLLTRGWSDRCFDLNVPRPWRRDVLQALLGQGHTVVPYAFCQRDAERAQVWVYDPNLPDRAAETVVTIDLVRDCYEYPPLAVDGCRTTIVAVPLAPYLHGRTAILASVASPFLQAPRRLLGVLVVSLLGLALFAFRHWSRKRESDRRGPVARAQAEGMLLTDAFQSAAAGAASASRR
uniref:DUF2330 domain-containing protein n=1 Tax=Thermomicrobium roseum TaxID=500 RepID=A0A7C5VV91_THERO